MPNTNTYKIINYGIAMVWFINGFLCKILNLVPRHKEIVGRILGLEYASFLTFAIGLSEVFMAMWVLSGIKSKLNAMLQISLVASMNLLEFILVPDLLLWGRFNALFALLFVLLVYFNQFYINKKSK